MGSLACQRAPEEKAKAGAADAIDALEEKRRIAAEEAASQLAFVRAMVGLRWFRPR